MSVDFVEPSIMVNNVTFTCTFLAVVVDLVFFVVLFSALTDRDEHNNAQHSYSGTGNIPSESSEDSDDDESLSGGVVLDSSATAMAF